MNYVKKSSNGYAIEKEVISYIELGLKLVFPSENVQVEYYNDYYDFHIKHNDKIIKKVEIKSCQYLINAMSRRFGRFDFTAIKNSKKQRTNNVEICFCVCIGANFEILGFLNSRTLNINRYISHNQLIKLRRLRTEKDFFKRIVSDIKRNIKKNEN